MGEELCLDQRSTGEWFALEKIKRMKRWTLLKTAVFAAAAAAALNSAGCDAGNDAARNKDSQVIWRGLNTPCGRQRVEINLQNSDTAYRFTGYEQDDTLQMLDAGARFYQPQLCQFSSLDPIDHPASSPYAYASNNPLNFVDPDGKQWKKSSQEKERTVSQKTFSLTELPEAEGSPDLSWANEEGRWFLSKLRNAIGESGWGEQALAAAANSIHDTSNVFFVSPAFFAFEALQAATDSKSLSVAAIAIGTTIFNNTDKPYVLHNIVVPPDGSAVLIDASKPPGTQAGMLVHEDTHRITEKQNPHFAKIAHEFFGIRAEIQFLYTFSDSVSSLGKTDFLKTSGIRDDLKNWPYTSAFLPSLKEKNDARPGAEQIFFAK